MADFDYFEDGSSDYYGYEAQQAGAAPTGSGRFGVLLNWAGALVSLGLVVGMGVWGWQLAMRDVSGVPVVRALEGPMRVPPADPGGVQAPNQGLAVNRIAEGAEAAPVPDRLVLAPPPVELAELDFDTSSTGGRGSAAAATPPAEAPQATTPEGAEDATQTLLARLLANSEPLDPAPLDPTPAPQEAVTPEIAQVAPVAEAPVAEAVAPGPVQVAQAQVIPASVPGVRVSLRPTLRPAGFARATNPDGPAVIAGISADVALEVTGRQGDGVREIAPADLPEGTRLVQLGAFDSADIARSEWGRLSARFPDFMADRARVIEEASSGGQRFYRLRAVGFDDLAASRRFCAALVAQGAACIPVTVR